MSEAETRRLVGKAGTTRQVSGQSWPAMQAKLDLWRAAGKPAQVEVFEGVGQGGAQHKKEQLKTPSCCEGNPKHSHN